MEDLPKAKNPRKKSKPRTLKKGGKKGAKG
jgi:hypothetical protein